MKKYFTLVMALTFMVTLYLLIYRNYIKYKSTVCIKNTHWQKMHVQVRTGYNSDPFHNRLVFDQYLTLGQSRTFSVDNGDDIMYRRDTDPNHGDGSHFTVWTYANCDNTSTCTVDNP